MSKQKHSARKRQKVTFLNWAINLKHRGVCLSGLQNTQDNTSWQTAQWSLKGRASRMQHDTHFSPPPAPPAPFGQRRSTAKTHNIPEFLHDADLNPGLRKEQCFSSEDRKKKTPWLCSWRGSDEFSFSPTESCRQEKTEVHHRYHCRSRDNTKREESKSTPKQQQWEDPSVGVSYLTSMVTSASTLIANLQTSPATKTLKSCQQTTTAHGPEALSGVFH